MSSTKIISFTLAFIAVFSAKAQIITTFAGNGTIGSSGNGIPATSAQLYDPLGICSDNAGNIYIADQDNHIVRKVNTAGIITTIAGNGTLGYSGDGGLATNAQLEYPYSVCVDNAGNIYISDGGPQTVIRKINSAGIISTFAGNGTLGYSGDGGPALLAQLGGITDICIDNSGNVYIADFSYSVIRKINTAGIITTVAGNGTMGGLGDGGPATLAQIESPTGISVDNSGNLFIAEETRGVIRKVNSAGIISIYAGGNLLGYGGDGGPATAAQLKYCYGVFAAADGSVYIGDTGNSVVRKVSNSGMITTIAGNGTLGYSGDGGPAIAAQLATPGDLCTDNAGNVYVVDPLNFVVRKIGDCQLTVISQNPVDQVICGSNGNTSFVVNASNASSFQWQVNSGTGWNNVNDNSIYAGSNTDNLSITGATSAMNNYQYRCNVSNSCATIFSTAALLTVHTPVTPSIAINATATTICTGANVTFIATPTNPGASPSYQWKKNGVNTGTNSSLYNDNNLNTGDVISCVLTSTSTCVTTNIATSNNITITVEVPVSVTITITASANNICPGTPVTFSSTITNGGATPAYTWFKNGVNLLFNSPTYTDNALNNGDFIMGVVQSSLACVVSQVVPSNEIQMVVNPSITPAITIAATNTSICSGAPVTFTATPVNGGISPSYQWTKNNLPVGNNSNTYTDNTISSSDIFTCTLTATGNCLTTPSATSNTVSIPVFNNPVVNIDHTNTLCKGDSRQLDAGSFASYAWNDGSSGRTLVINNTGTYYVTVTDNNGCKGSDTARITTLLPSPAGFMPADTSICSYGSLQLQALPGYTNYLWNTGSAVSFVTITQPGLYWLEVTDDNNCKGKDTVTVLLKECMKGFYIPTAFTPNGDGKNDFFKPLLFGNIKEYSFFIYNRWGNIVFQTKEPAKGWDGTFNGMQQDTSVFIWMCTYQLEGEERKTEKGTVVLIR